MQRRPVPERPDWRAQASQVGFDVLTDDGQPYWDESVCYRFSLAQIEEQIEAPTQDLIGLCYEAVDYILGRDPLLRRMAIPVTAWDYLRRSWRRQDKDLYGRFDLRYDGVAPAKLYEFNADTPTALFEAAVFQWRWLEQSIASGALPESADQFNSIHDRLIAAFRGLGMDGRRLHFACVRDHREDRWTVEYLEDCARQAGLVTGFVHIEDIGLTGAGDFTDLDDRVITDLFKLYPWEWLIGETYGSALLRDRMRLIEPPWKMLLSNKGLLAVLWEMFPDHPALLPTWFEDDPRIESLGPHRVRKPLLGREGSNVTILGTAQAASRDGPYGAEGHVVQAPCPLPVFDGRHPVIGAWVVAGQACGIGIREDDGPITGNGARFVPHYIGAPGERT